jgi:hypothetical protein
MLHLEAGPREFDINSQGVASMLHHVGLGLWE